MSAIARHTGRDRKTIRAWLERGEQRRRARAPSVLEPYRADVERGFSDDPHLDATVLLRPLLALPVEVVLPAHGAPTDRAALERALS